ncbi:glycosyltransferase family 4 protein [Pseudanabaena sp. FACHB-2040]|uniref:glycosyltransferase family 4 protein n=1 Tax=Pseudanabaena sp. FACHB-2040 TaxID=2692859 RepID=UPI0016850B75|nr:glycosyltransferase family 4 protein [Pseudanabaena sp. FACHB-2040]MBD2258127.1 glycosyltransferase family 4 protein [Pseudanabaena sp. FACHB-2040]
MVDPSHKLNLLFLSTPVGPLGSGLGGGVELTLTNLCQVLQKRGHRIAIAAPTGSSVNNTALIELPGALQPTAHTQGRQTPVTLPSDAVLANMCAYAHQAQTSYDLIVNFAYDWLPFYLTPFFDRAIAHFISMGSLSDAMDAVIGQVAEQFPKTLGVYTHTQADTFSFAQQCRILGSAVDLNLYEYCDQPGPWMAWMGRISPEKGLEDAVAAAQISGIPLKILGKLEDTVYWQRILDTYPEAPVEYLGFLPTAELQAVLRQCRALLMTPRWVEAFGNVAIEALACGVPVITYARGGPTEIVQPGKTGWLVEPDCVAELVEAMQKVDELSRRACREQAVREYSLDALGDRFEQWFSEVLSTR